MENNPNNYNQGNYNQQGYNQQGYQQQGYNPGYNQGYQQPGYGYSMRPYKETTANNAFNCGPEGKARGIFAILALIGGTIGLHYFYVNKVAAAIITIVLVFVTCGLWAIIPFLQGILGLWTMTNEEFDRKYVCSTSAFPLF